MGARPRTTLAHSYARALWWVLAMISFRGSVHDVVLPGLHRDELLDEPGLLDVIRPAELRDWWRVIKVVNVDEETRLKPTRATGDLLDLLAMWGGQ